MKNLECELCNYYLQFHVKFHDKYLLQLNYQSAKSAVNSNLFLNTFPYIATEKLQLFNQNIFLQDKIFSKS